MIGVAQDDLGARLLEVLEEHSLDRALRPHRHEGRVWTTPCGVWNSPSRAPPSVRNNAKRNGLRATVV